MDLREEEEIGLVGEVFCSKYFRVYFSDDSFYFGFGLDSPSIIDWVEGRPIRTFFELSILIGPFVIEVGRTSEYV